MDHAAILQFIRRSAQARQVKISLHATEEAVAEDINRSDILTLLENAKLLEDYPDWWLGPCCLLFGQTTYGRNLHVVSSYGQLPVTIITVYEPKPPKWATPVQRGVSE
jgi:hypothetical protein